MLEKNVVSQSSRITNFILSSEIFGNRDRIDIFNEWSQPEKLRMIHRRPTRAHKAQTFRSA